MKKVHLVLQGKGGVGKSFISSLIAQYLLFTQGSDTVHCFDTDPVNQTLARFNGLNAEVINIMNDDKNIDQSKFDYLIETIIENDGIALVDNGSATFVPLISYLRESNILELLSENNVEVIIHVPLQGGQALKDTVAGLYTVMNDMATAKIVVWLNHHLGKVDLNGVNFKEWAIYKDHEARISGVIDLVERNPDTFGKDLKQMTESNLTFDEVATSSEFTILPKSRLKTVKNDIFGQLSNINVF